jgi:ParB family chromosome partitioning protein
MAANRPPRAALGRGLAALIPAFSDDAPHAAPLLSGSGEGLRMIRIDRIRPNPEQPRFSFAPAALDQLAESIRHNGIITPLLVRRATQGDGWVLVAGERRLRAAGLAGLDEVPCWVRDHLDSREQLELALVENLQREDLDALEVAESYRRLVDDFGLTQSEVARRVGKDRATVANHIRLLRLPDFALEALRAGDISAGHAKALLALPDEDRLRRALRETTTRGLSVRATEKLVSELLSPRPRRPSSGPAPAVVQASELAARALGAPIKVESRGRGGRIVIPFRSKDDLDRILGLLGASA